MASQEGPSRQEYSERWEVMWSGGNDEYEVKNGDGGVLKPGQAFDAGKSAPHLTALLERHGLGSLQDKTILIPGCGRGYDVITFAKFGAGNVIGMELAPTAVTAANRELSERLGSSNGSTDAKVVQGDFFEKTAQQYDIGYDYTFFCAIHPNMRNDWASAWREKIKKGGLLVTSIFPVLPSRDGTGPPWPVWPELYQEKLESVGFKLKSLDKVPEKESHPGREGKEYLAIWERQ